MTLQLLLSLCICGGILLLTRLYYVLPVFNQPTRYVSKRRKGKTSVHQSSEKMLCVVLGSGGHTAEMVRLLQGVEFDRFMERLYIVGNNDTLSLDQISLVENHGNVYNGEYYVERVPRSREVGQPWTSALLSAASCLRRAVAIMFDYKPDVILCNGPGNCVIVCLVALVIRLLGLKHIPIVYVESFARVRTLSLSGKLLYPLADRFIVQWPMLVHKYPRAEFIPHLV